jgi:hypothetical protein
VDQGGQMLVGLVDVVRVAQEVLQSSEDRKRWFRPIDLRYS